MSEKEPLSIYIHIPFCRKRCGYCDFNTSVGLDYLLEEYENSLIFELDNYSSQFNSTHYVHTVYFGGGTPTIMPVSFFQRILNTISNHFSLVKNLEISSEGNPFELKADYLSRTKYVTIRRNCIW